MLSSSLTPATPHLPIYLNFLESPHGKKGTGTWNNMEQNIYDGLRCTYTIMELCILTLYTQAISHPYLGQVWGPNQLTANLLDLGPLHEHVKAHCHRVIENLDLLLAPDTSYQTGALDSQLWDCPEAVYAVLRRTPDLPHLKPTLVAFFTGALETWERFTVEFAQGGTIVGLSPSECQQAWMRTDVRKSYFKEITFT
ncbi:hypothetical protein C8T65DRAFT_747948 [Cerioporus squamosus]|nr:hypothetical protein C8T65DRAFT_747948 [Cerioporus squamosus]